MKLIIAGGRDLTISTRMLSYIIEHFKLEPTEVVSGACGRPETENVFPEANAKPANGIDGVGEIYALANNIQIKRMPAQWSKYGDAAGPIRNREMAEHADALLLIWDGKSKGSASMRREMKRLNKPIFNVVLRDEPAEAKT